MNQNFEPQRPLRVILTSDVHLTSSKAWYGISDEDRLQHWVDSILEEHRRSPIDLIIFAGDCSLDHYLDRGSYTAEGVSMTKIFMEKYVTQLPAGVPVYIAPGNHELYSDEQWAAYTGYRRNGSVVTENDLFIVLDSFGDPLEPNFDCTFAKYTPMDVNFIQEQMDKYPDKRVWLVSHWFEPGQESEEFKRIVRENDRVKGLFAGHSHRSNVICYGEEFGNKCMAQTGNFSYSFFTPFPTDDINDLYNSFWGFRELLIYENEAQSNYIVAKTSIPPYKGIPLDLERKLVFSIEYFF